MPLNAPFHSTLEKEVKKAAKIITELFDSKLNKDKAIPIEMIRNCCGFAVLTVIKAGFIWSGKMGTGLVLCRLEDGSWSPPSAIGTAGVGFGAEVGGEIIDILIFLGSAGAVRTFKKGTQISLGANLDIAVGPVGRSASASMNAGGAGIGGNYTYSRAKGLFAGVGLHGSTILIRGEMNSRFYGHDVTPMEILSGNVQPPEGTCDVLYEAIQCALLSRMSERDSIPRLTASEYHQTREISSHRTSLSETKARPASMSSYSEQIQDDPRLRRFSRYKSEKELYAEFQRQKSTQSNLSIDSASLLRKEPAPLPAQGPEVKELYAQVMTFIRTQCPQADLQEFKTNCRLFGQDEMALTEYYGYLCSICSVSLQPHLIPNLIRLLPTAEKREQLHDLYCEQKRMR